jgi:hypothetical protein
MSSHEHKVLSLISKAFAANLGKLAMTVHHTAPITSAMSVCLYITTPLQLN